MERWPKPRKRRERADFKRDKEEPDDEPHIKLKLLTRGIHQRKAFVDPISDASTLAETILGAVLLSFRRSLSVINVLRLSSAYVQLRPNPRPDATVREKKQARDSSWQRDPIRAVPRPFVSARL
ncbi:hypothetical protein F2Q69_00044000 [Brassica cretica]|uniref:Uncharacterized protein n=1 Tax=Brassica cretica TaxID=69181 RepID=A0A8S9NFN7_BRACR|nr:hypothetical protein F2Q69_00044000 [Brassica cretica]